VLLAADVRLADVHALGWAGLVTVLALMLVVRPACVLASAARSGVPWRQRIFLAWIGPRGIVAAAVASLFATRLDDAGVDGGAQLRALTFLVIAATVVTAGLTGGVVARWLGLRRASDDGWLIMGASPLARAIASSLADAGERSVLVDRNPEDCREAAALGLEVIHGNALEERTLERAYLDTRRGALALTRNDEVNLLFASRCRRLGKLRRLYVALSGAAQGVTAEIARKAGCELLGGRGLDVERWCQRITDGRAAFAWWILHEPGVRSEASRTADDGRELVVPLLRRRGRAVAPVGDLRALAQGDVVRFVIDAGRVESARAQLRAAGFRELVDEPEAATRPAV
ncbi:MAG: cation:proton antiporter, partial [Myxococcales bacterium]|nr:cation:proton antiporter [Myxococcales bacterium]